MNKSELVVAVAQKTGLSRKDTEATISTFLDEIKSSLANNDRVLLVGFGSFEAHDRAERKGRNPKTKEEIVIPATRVPTFKAGKEFKEALK